MLGFVGIYVDGEGVDHGDRGRVCEERWLMTQTGTILHIRTRH
jgi:hypothetical protein